jgi:iron complex transport system ATP-binding protein
MESDMLRINELSFAYSREPVLENISLSVAEGRLCCLLGPNGCGKTTLLKCCLGFIKPQRGRILLNGKCITTFSASRQAKVVAYVPQNHAPAFPYAVRTIVEMGRNPHSGSFGFKSEEHAEHVRRALEITGIEDLENRPYTQLSGGQRQLVLLARAYAQNTPLILLDEPTASLDFKNQMLAWRIIRSFADAGKTILISTHHPNHVLWFADDVAVISGGRLAAFGQASSVVTQEILDEIYQQEAVLERHNGLPLILPRMK